MAATCPKIQNGGLYDKCMEGFIRHIHRVPINIVHEDITDLCLKNRLTPGGALEWQEGVSGSSMDSQKAP